MSKEMIIYEESIFTSSGLGKTGFNKSNKKQETFNFTPSPTRDFLYDEIKSGLFHEIDTYENTPLDCLYSRSLKENINNKSIDNIDTDFITNFYNDASEKIIQNNNSNNFIDCFNKKRINYKKKNSLSSIGALENNQDNYSALNKKNQKNENATNFNKTFKKTVTFENKLFNTPQMGRKAKKSSDIIPNRKNSSIIVNNFKEVLESSTINNCSINPNNKTKIANNVNQISKSLYTDNQLDIKKSKISNKNLSKVEFNPKNIVVDINKEKEIINESLKIMKKNTMILPSIKRELNFNLKDDLPKNNKFKTSLSLRRKKSFKEDPELAKDKIFSLKLSPKFNNYKEYEELNTSQVNDCNFYEHTEDCFKIISKLDKKIISEGFKNKEKIIFDKILENKLTSQNYKLALFDLNETLLHYSLDNTKDFEHRLCLEITSNDNEKTNQTIGVNIRPYIFECLKELSKTYIIGLFTSTERELAEKLIKFIDPNDQIFQIKLFRENCLKLNNPIFQNLLNNKLTDDIKKFNKNNSPLLKEFLYLKDLRVLDNIPIEKIVIIDNSVLGFCTQLENGIPIFPFYNDKTDSELRVLINYLNHLSNVKDVRIENRNIIKLDSLYRMVPLIQEYSSSSSIETNGYEFFYDSENANNISNLYLKNKSSSKNIIGMNPLDNFDYSSISNVNNLSKLTNNNNNSNMTHVTFNGNSHQTLNNSINSFGNEIRNGSPIIKNREIMKQTDMSFQVLFVKTTEEDLQDNNNSNKTVITNTMSYDSSSSQSKTNSSNNNNNTIFNIENNKDKKELDNFKSNNDISTHFKSKINPPKNKDSICSNSAMICNNLNNLSNGFSNGSNNNNICELKGGKLKISNFEIVNINNINCLNNESKDFSSQSPTNTGFKSNFDTNFSFGGSEKKCYFSNKSLVSNRSNISNKSILQEKLFVCLEEFHSKYTNFFKNNNIISQNPNDYE